ncbi:MAG: Crp/Fnr family transcriptional regulator [Clostridiales bacterium]|nr:Crp/Fnr family transcriptional regulator [Clostridiales bacterium]
MKNPNYVKPVSLWNSSRILSPDFILPCLEKLGSAKKVPKNTYIYRSDEIPDCCYIVKSGEVIALETTSGGNEFLHFLMDENAIFGDVNMLMEKPLPIRFRTATDCELICIPKEKLMTAIAQDSRIFMELYLSAANKFLDSIEELREFKLYPASWRLIKMLLTFADKYGTDYDGKLLIRRKLSINYLTALIGVNRATTIRSLNGLKKEKLIETVNGFYCIRDPEALKRYQARLAEDL